MSRHHFVDVAVLALFMAIPMSLPWFLAACVAAGWAVGVVFVVQAWRTRP